MINKMDKALALWALEQHHYMLVDLKLNFANTKTSEEKSKGFECGGVVWEQGTERALEARQRSEEHGTARGLDC